MTDRGIHAHESTIEVPAGKRRVVRLKNVALIGVGTGAAVGVLLGAVVILRGVGRQPTGRERLERLVPRRGAGRVRVSSRGRTPVQPSVGVRRSGKEPQRPSWESSAVRIAGTLGTAAGTALVGTLISQVLRRTRERAVESVQHALSEP